MPADRLDPMLRAAWKVHGFVRRPTDRRRGARMGPFKVLLLEYRERTRQRIPVLELSPRSV